MKDVFNNLENSKYSALLILVLVIAVYFPSTKNDYIWDDDAYVKKAPQFHALGFSEGLSKIWLEPRSTDQYYPLVHSSYFFEYYLWGTDAWGYHLVNILLHALTAVLLWCVLKALSVPWALAIALLFALHPVHVESVAWLTERKNVLSGALYMASVLLFLKWQQGRNKNREYQKLIYIFSLALFVLAVLSKTVTCTLPAVLLVLMWWQHSKLSKQHVLPLIPFFVFGVGMGLITAYIEKEHAGAIGKAWDFTLPERFVIAGQAILFYISKLAWPENLTFFYPRWDISQIGYGQYLFPLSIVLMAVIFFYLRKKIGKGPLAAYLIFAGTLFPALGFINVYPMLFSFVADHFQYLASVAMIALLVGGIRMALCQWAQPLLVYMPYCLIVVLLFFSWRSQELQSQYKNEESLWLSTIKKNPQAFLPHNNLGVIYMRRAENKKAFQYLATAIKLNPDFILSLNNYSTVCVALGKSLKESVFFDEALKSAQRAVQLSEEEKTYNKTHMKTAKVSMVYASSYRALAAAKMAKKDKIGAKKAYMDLLREVPNDWKTFNRLGGNCLLEGQYQDALNFYERSLNIHPQQIDALSSMAAAYYKLGQWDKSIQYSKRSIALDIDKILPMPYYYLGLCLQKKKMFQEAIPYFKWVIKISPQHPIAAKAKKQLMQIKKARDSQ